MEDSMPSGGDPSQQVTDVHPTPELASRDTSTPQPTGDELKTCELMTHEVVSREVEELSKMAASIAVSNRDERQSSPAVSEGSVEEVSASLIGAALGTAAKSTNRTKESASKSSKRKEDKGIEHVLKALNSLETTEEKLAALCKKYTELLEEHRVMQSKSKQNQRKLTALTREKDQLQNEQSKTVLAKSKLESLCRELQRHNKLIKDESVARARDEEEKRKEVTAKFQTTINDIQRQMNENYEKNNKLREENVELATKLKNLIEQYELREQHIEKVFKHKELEQQLVDAKLAQANLQMTEEKERFLKEKQLLIEQSGHQQTKVELLEKQETQLRHQVALYTDKYEEFQSTLAKSNEVFQSFKSEMEKMTKKIKKLEKETTMWRSRWENSNKALLDMAEEKTRSDKEISLLNSKVQKLESLCRALQEERKKVTSKTRVLGPPSPMNGDVKTNCEEEKLIEPTKTPPNTPSGGSRGSPATVQPQTNGPQLPLLNIVDIAQSEQTPQAMDQSEQASQALDQSEESLQALDQSAPDKQQTSVIDQSRVVLDKEVVADQSESTTEAGSDENSQLESLEQIDSAEKLNI